MFQLSEVSKVSAVIVMPAGPADDAIDTVRSALFFCEPTTQIVVVDDTKKPEFATEVETLGDRVHIVKAADIPGAVGGLWNKIAQGYRYALDNFEFDVILRLDADALIIGPTPEADAREHFEANPGVGLLGSYRVNCNGVTRDFGPAVFRMRREAGPLGLRKPRMRRALRASMKLAAENGYEIGEHCLGGAYFHSSACARALYDAGYLDIDYVLKDSLLGEDHIAALATKALSFDIGDFAIKGTPLALGWRGLPMAPEEMLAQGKKVTHSVRFWEGMDEKAVRSFFQQTRTTISVDEPVVALDSEESRPV